MQMQGMKNTRGIITSATPPPAPIPMIVSVPSDSSLLPPVSGGTMVVIVSEGAMVVPDRTMVGPGISEIGTVCVSVCVGESLHSVNKQ